MYVGDNLAIERRMLRPARLAIVEDFGRARLFAESEVKTGDAVVVAVLRFESFKCLRMRLKRDYLGIGADA
jgi:hypothetical protein